MSAPFEHDYKGFSEVSSMEKLEGLAESAEVVGLRYRETELRLGLPGSQSPERKEDEGVYGSGLLKNFMLGAKRGFSHAIDGRGKWVLAGASGSSEVEQGKGVAALFSPRGANLGKSSTGFDGLLAPVAAGKEVGASTGYVQEKKPQVSATNDPGLAPAAKAQVVGWPPIRSFRKNTMAANPVKAREDADEKAGLDCLYVKVSMDGAPYLRKVDLRTYSNYTDLSSALEKMFRCFTLGKYASHGAPRRDAMSERLLMDLLHGSEYVLTYEDKDGDWMLVGDVPWEMFTSSCRRLRIMKGTEAIGLAPRAMEKSKTRN